MIKILIIVFATIFYLSNTVKINAIEDPLTLDNNKFGVHILFPAELSKAAQLVNSNGGDFGYVTIPIQGYDKDLVKWQDFMDEAKKYHLIPIIRLATENYYFNTTVWRKPSEDDILDFANFLNSLKWPVKNKYIVVFNEVNRGDEWGGIPDAKEYANILDFAVSAFKSKSDDFFVISAGLDNAAANVESNSINQYTFMNQMNESVPGIFDKIDGLGSHSYPNPAFSQVPWIITDKSVSSFIFERNLVNNLSDKKLPIFITETGWSNKKVSEDKIAFYFTYAFESIWSDKDIVAVTPFLLHAGGEPFSQFSLLNEDGGDNDISKALKKISKIKGQPTADNNSTISPDISSNVTDISLRKFPQKTQYDNSQVGKTETITTILKWLLRVPI